MCAIAGIANNKDAVANTYLMLYALQHRGQESAGIAATNGSMSLVKKMGLVRSIFKEKDFKKLSGDFAIGHIRYSTAGSSMIKNAQPFVANVGGEEVAICHNGNLVNASSLKRSLKKKKIRFESSSDTEVVLHLMKLSKKKNLEEKLIDALSQVEGAYSILILAKNKIIAARDPFGFRPLSLGKLKQSFVLASENCAFRLIEANFVRDINPGEILSISGKDKLKSFYPFKKPKNFRQCFFELVYFSRPDSFVFGNEVVNFRKKLGIELARHDKVKADLVSPIPDSSNFIALGYGQARKIPFETGILRSHYIGRTFIEPDQEIRNFGTKLKLFPIRGILKGKRAVIVDDSIVRGTTSKKVINLIKAAGKTKKIHFRVGCPRIIGPCYYGIDTPTRKELIAANFSDKEICKKIGADSLIYLTIDDLKKCLGKNSKNYCFGCLTGKYPTEIPEK